MLGRAVMLVAAIGLTTAAEAAPRKKIKRPKIQVVQLHPSPMITFTRPTASPAAKWRLKPADFQQQAAPSGMQWRFLGNKVKMTTTF